MKVNDLVAIHNKEFGDADGIITHIDRDIVRVALTRNPKNIARVNEYVFSKKELEVYE